MATTATFNIFSEISSGWIDRFSNDTLDSIDDHNYNRYLNWYYTGTNDNDPIFWDEGSTLRIAETNFKLVNELYSAFNSEGLVEESQHTDTPSTMEANPNQWIGYKDLRTHFGDVFNYLGDTYGFFIGKSNKTWKYSIPATDNEELTGLITSLDTAISETTDFGLDEAKMRIHMEKGTSNGIDWGGNIKV